VKNGEAEEGEIRAIGIGCDVSSETSVKSAMAEVVDTFGQIDSLVASAGGIPFTSFITFCLYLCV